MDSQTQRYARAGSLEGFRDFVLSYKCDPDAILTKAGINPAVLDSPEALINMPSYWRALNEASARTGVARFGLLLSQRQTLEKLGPVGYLMRHAPTLGESLDELIRFLKVHATGMNIYLEQHHHLAILSVQLTGLSGDSVVQHCELSVGLITKFFRTVISESWSPKTIYFEHSAPENLSDYQHIFRCPVHFGQALTAIEFPVTQLTTPLKSADAGLYQVLRDYLNRLDKEQGDNFVDQVIKVIHQQLEQGLPRIDEACALLNLTRHELQQKLKREGTNYQALLEEERIGVATYYLKDTELSLIEITSILGLSEPAVLTRLFKRKLGLTPSAWRTKNKKT
ncbi:AraC family transcriptional regulator ligand-binding domain-containing protein [Colwellia sp. MEBiC06753]